MTKINLLPPKIKKDIELKKKNREAVLNLTKVLFSLVAATIIGSIVWWHLNSKIKLSEEILQNVSQSIEKYGNLEQEAKKTADKIDKIDKIEKNLDHWSPLMREIQELIPQDTTLTKLSISTDPKVRCEIIGYAKDKASISALRDNMENSDYFEYVDIVNTTTESPSGEKTERENFNIGFSLEKGALDE